LVQIAPELLLRKPVNTVLYNRGDFIVDGFVEKIGTSLDILA